MYEAHDSFFLNEDKMKHIIHSNKRITILVLGEFLLEVTEATFQVIWKKTFNILILAMLDFLKKPIIIQIRNLILVILVTPMMFLRQFGMEGENISKWSNYPIKLIFHKINVKIGSWMN